MIQARVETSTYDHRVWKTGLSVRSAVLKPHTRRLVIRRVLLVLSLMHCDRLTTIVPALGGSIVRAPEQKWAHL